MRVFIALETTPYEEELYKILIDIKKEIKEPVKWVSKENLHVTTKFLGEIEIEFLNEIKNIVKNVSTSFKQFDFSIVGISGFPLKNKARVLFFSIEDKNSYIVEIMKKLDTAFSKYGFEREHNYVPHITFGRAGKDFINLENLKINYVKIEVKAMGLTIYESILERNGPIYNKLDTFNFNDKIV